MLFFSQLMNQTNNLLIYRWMQNISKTVRVTAINISTTLTTFFSDQLNSEQHIESRVDAGEITPREADEMNEEWENREWELRKDALPRKIGWALLRFHACTALMRFYEFITARYVLRVDGDSRGPSPLLGGSNATAAAATIDSGVRGSSSNALTHEQAITVMDNLTRDPYQASRRTSQLLHNQEHSPGKVISSNGIENSTSRELMKRMFDTCIWANIIPFLAELTVQQGVLIYGYVVYYRAKTRRKREREESKDVEDDDEDNEEPLLPPAQCKEEDKSDDDMSAYALSLMFRSSRLTIAKSMSWIVASAGGAVGSAVYPGWGCVFGIQIGDTVVGALID